MENHYTLTTLHLGNLDIELLDLYQMLASSRITEFSHNHAFFEIHFILNGAATMRVQKNAYEVKKNNIFIIPKNHPHCCEKHSSDFQFCAFCFQLSYGFKPPEKRVGEYGYFTELFQLKEACVLPMREEERRLIEKILSLRNDFSVYAINKINIQTTNLFLEMAKQLDEFKNLRLHSIYTSLREEDSLRKYKVESFILSHYEQPCKIEDLANFLSLSVRQTSRYIKEAFGLTFKELVCKQRMQHAQNLIEKGEIPLCKIATAVGYTSYNGFISAYKKQFGKSPEM
jgi:AraC-like DNA-binding protein